MDMPIIIRINYNSGKQNYISLPARFGSITTKGFIHAASLKQLYKTANKYAVEISANLNIDVNRTHLIQSLEIGITGFLLNYWGYVAEMEMSVEFVTFYNVAAFAFLSEDEFIKYEISFNGEGEFMKLIA